MEVYELNMENEIRIGTRRDYHELVRLRAEWIDWFCQSHPASERWCSAMCRVPRIENEDDLLWHLIERDRRWPVICKSQGKLQGYILCRSDSDKKELLIEGQTPRVSPSLVDAVVDEVGRGLIQFVLRHGVEQKLEQVKMSFHGFSDEISLLMCLYRREGFICEPWYEMFSHKLDIEPGPQSLQFRSAGELGLDTFYESEAITGQCSSAEDSKKDCEISQKMWGSIDPNTDWLMAYDDGRLVGTVRVAVNREGIGVLDGIAIIEEYRGRGLGRCLLAKGLSALIGRTEIVRSDCFQDNIPAVRLYRRAGFKVHHEHGELKKELERDERVVNLTFRPTRVHRHWRSLRVSTRF
jgi:ribosomal protein S18 acetylase RimI-like enzyme